MVLVSSVRLQKQFTHQVKRERFSSFSLNLKKQELFSGY